MNASGDQTRDRRLPGSGIHAEAVQAEWIRRTEM
jgi:hypothetical protein